MATHYQKTKSFIRKYLMGSLRPDKYISFFAMELSIQNVEKD